MPTPTPRAQDAPTGPSRARWHPLPLAAQVARLRRRHGLAEPVARVLAGLAYGDRA